MSQESATLSPVERLDCFGKPFGYSVASMVQDHGDTSEYTNREVATLRDKVIGLYGSIVDRDIEAVDCINSLFYDTEHTTLNTKTPLFGRDRQGSPDILAWLIRSSNDEIAQFAVANVARQQRLQDVLGNIQPTLEQYSLLHTDNLVRTGLLPGVAMHAVTSAREHYGVPHAMDPFEAGAMGADGYCNKDRIALRNLYAFPGLLKGISSWMKGVAFHEDIHGAGITTQTGFMTGMYTDVPMRWAEEAFAAHATQVVLNSKQPDVIAPQQRRDRIKGVYKNERLLLGYLDIPASLLGCAFFSERGSSERRTLEHMLAENFEYGVGIDLYDFANEYEYAPSGYSRRAVVNDALNMFYSRNSMKLIQFDDEPVPEGELSMFGQTIHP